MTRHSGRNHTREHIAYLAARLMAEDGIEDYGLAKRKAARQAGIPDSRQMPDNDEIDAALTLYRKLYQCEHALQLRELRRLALEMMEELASFDPHLTGSVLRGSAGKYAGIYLQLFTDNVKSIEHHLLDHKIDFRSCETRLYAGDMPVIAPEVSFNRGGIDIHLTLLTPRELRSPLKASMDGKPIERARREAVKALIDAS